MKIIKHYFIGLLVLIFFSSIVRLEGQQCNSSAIPDGEDYNTGNVFQSFEAECDGELASIAIDMAFAPEMFILKIFEGGITSNSTFTDCSHLPTVQIYEQEFAGVDGYNEYVFTNALPMLSSGLVYSFQISDPSAFWTYNSGQYDNGILYGGLDLNGNCFCSPDFPCDFMMIDHDLLFSVNVNRIAPIPTLGQWSTLALLIILSILGLVFIKNTVRTG